MKCNVGPLPAMSADESGCHEEGKHLVQLYGYDISGGLAQQMSLSLIGLLVLSIIGQALC